MDSEVVMFKNFENLSKLCFNIIEINFYQDKNNWNHKLIPTDVYKNDSDRVVDLLMNKHHYALIKNLMVFSGSHSKIFICRRFLNFYTSENMLMIKKPKCENYNITTISN